MKKIININRGRQYYFAFSAILLVIIGVAILHWHTQESTLSDVLGVESMKIVDARICNANDPMNTEVKLDSKQIENVLQMFYQTKVKRICVSGVIQNCYARFYFETEDCERYEVLLASNEVLINPLNHAKWYVYSIISPNNNLEMLMKDLW